MFTDAAHVDTVQTDLNIMAAPSGLPGRGPVMATSGIGHENVFEPSNSAGSPSHDQVNEHDDDQEGDPNNHDEEEDTQSNAPTDDDASDDDTGYDDFVNAGVNCNHRLMIPPVSHAHILSQYQRDRSKNNNPKDMELVDDFADSIMKTATSMAAQLRAELMGPVSRQVYAEYVEYANTNRDGFISRLTKEALPFVKRRVDEEFRKRHQKQMKVSSRFVDAYQKEELDRVQEEVEAEKTRLQKEMEAEQARVKKEMRQFLDKAKKSVNNKVKKYNEKQYTSAVAELDKATDVSYKALDKAIDKFEKERMTNIDERLATEKENRRAVMLSGLNREVEDARAVAMSKMVADIAREESKMRADLTKQMAEEEKLMRAKIDTELKTNRNDLQARLDAEYESARATMLNEIEAEREARRCQLQGQPQDECDEEVIGNATRTTSPDPPFRSSPSLTDNQAGQDEDLEGDTLTNLTPGHIIDASSPGHEHGETHTLRQDDVTDLGSTSKVIGKKRSRSEHDEHEDLDYLAANLGANGNRHEANQEPSAKKRRSGRAYSIDVTPSPITGEKVPLYHRGTSAPLGASAAPQTSSTTGGFPPMDMPADNAKFSKLSKVAQNLSAASVNPHTGTFNMGSGQPNILNR